MFSSVATAVTLCLFDDEGREQQAAMTAGPGGLWQCYLAGVGPGQRYGYRVDGPWDPGPGPAGQPGQAAARPLRPGHRRRRHLEPVRLRLPGWTTQTGATTSDSAPSVPRSVVVHPAHFDWGADRPPRHALADTILYEAHVKGLTARHPGIPHELRGTYLGLAHPAMIAHLTGPGRDRGRADAGAPVPRAQYLADRGLTNYWGYDTIGFFAPHHGYSVRPPRRAGRPSSSRW